MQEIIHVFEKFKQPKDPKHITCLSFCLMSGWTKSPRTSVKSVKLIEQAIKAGDITAYLMYAFFLLNGEGPFNQNKEKAL